MLNEIAHYFKPCILVKDILYDNVEMYFMAKI
jgi:hypothetical protein